GVATGGGDVVDWLPETATRDTGFGLASGQAPLAADSGWSFDAAGAPLFGPGGRLDWAPPAGELDGAARFRRHVATRVGPQEAGATPAFHENAAHLTSADSAGGRAVARDTAGYTVHTPLLAIVARITDNGATHFPT